MKHWFEDSHKVARNTHSSLTCEKYVIDNKQLLENTIKVSCLLAGVVHVLAIGM